MSASNPISDLYRKGIIPLIPSAVICLFLSAGCSGENAEQSDSSETIRGLKTVLVSDQEETTVRQYPSVLQPASLTVLSFELSGKLTEFDLEVGQTVEEGDVLATLDTTSLTLQAEAAQAALEQTKATFRNAEADYQRKAVLQKDGVISRAELDQSTANMQSARSQVQQAQKQLESASDNISKATLTAPFTGIINSVEVNSYSTITTGSPVASLYSSEGFEASFSVSFNVVDQLNVGKPVSVTLADRPDTQLTAVISELGSRADTVSSFPVVVSLTESHPLLKAGMAVGISMEFVVPRGSGYTLPLQVLALNKAPQKRPDSANPINASVFVYDPDTSSVTERGVQVGGVSENDVIVVDGLVPGERVAVAGVSFLRDGQRVKLLDTSPAVEE